MVEKELVIHIKDADDVAPVPDCMVSDMEKTYETKVLELSEKTFLQLLRRRDSTWDVDANDAFEAAEAYFAGRKRWIEGRRKS
jgi:hypothetical protein